mgnify:CR=1 FL=1
MNDKSQKSVSDYAKRFDAIRQLKNVIPQFQRHNYSLLQVEKGGFFRLSDRLYHVQDIYTYEERNKKGKTTWQWQELELYDIENGTIKYLELEDDDGLEITLSNSEIKIRELHTSFKNILSIVDDEEGYVQYKDVSYYYEDDSKAYFIKSDKEQIVKLYEFESDNKEYITVEAWGDEADEYEIFHSIPVDEQSIEILVTGS